MLVASGMVASGLPLLPASMAGASLSVGDLEVEFPDPMSVPKSASATLPVPELSSPSPVADITAGLVEVVEQRTATTKTFLTETPGRLLTQAFSGPVHFFDSAVGRWLPIETRLVSTGLGRVGLSTNSFGLDVSLDQTAAELAKIEVGGGKSVAFGLEGARPGVGVPGLESVSYHGVLKDTDLRLTSQPGGLKEDIVLHSADAPDTFVFPLRLEGLTVELDEATGGLVYRDGSGMARGLTPAGFMVDSNVDPHSGEGVRSDEVTYSLVAHGGALALRVMVSRAWLEASERVFPVFVDPTWNSTTLSDDTFVSNGYNANESGNTELKMGLPATDPKERVSYMHYDVSGLNGKVIDSATFSINNFHSWSCAQRGTGVYRVLGGWTGSNLTTWGAQPGLGMRVGWTPTTLGYTGCPGGRLSFGQDGVNNFMLDTVRNWTSTSWAPNGLAMKVDPGSEGDTYAWKKFDSWNACSGGSCIPRIDILWSEPPPTNQNPFGSLDSAAGDNGRVHLSGWGIDPDTTASVDVHVYIDGGFADAFTANSYRPDVGSAYPGKGDYHGFDRYITTTAGSHSVCVYLINIPSGANPGIGCPTVNVPAASAPALPAVLSSTHPSQTAWYASNSPQFTFSATDAAHGINGYSWALNQSSGTVPDDTADGSSPVSYSGKADGTWWFHVKARNGANPNLWGATAHYQVNIDSTAPTVSILSSSTHPSQSAWYPNNTPSFGWSASDSSEITGYSHILDQTAGTNPDTSSEGAGTSWTAPAKPDGTWWFHVRAVNGQGAWGPALHYQVNIDVTAPTAVMVLSSTHPPQTAWNPSNSPAFSWSASDTSDIAGYSWSFDQIAGGDPGTANATATTTASYSGKADGTWYFHVRAKNGAGAWSGVTTYTVKIDASAPIAPATVSSPTHPANQVGNSRAVTLLWTAGSDATSGVAGYRYTVNQSATTPADGTSSFTASTSPPPYPVNADGVWYAHVRTVDNAGNLSTDKVYGPIYIDTTAPTITKAVNRASAGRGETVTYTITLTNTKAFPITVTSVSDTLADTLTGLPASATVDDTTACTPVSTPACVVGTQSFSASNISVPANGTRKLAFQALVLGTERACTSVSNTASATNATATTQSGPAVFTTCDTGLGLEPWWTYVNEAIGPQGQASVNVANGNLVVTQTDSSPVGGHGRLAYVLRRSYNSSESTSLSLPAGLGNPGIGAGWQLNVGQTDDLVGDGLGATALIVPQVNALDPVTVVYVDRDGTRHVFRPKGLAANAAVDVTTLTTGTLAALRPNVLLSGIDPVQYRVCADQTFQAPPGVHVALWRYVRVANSGASPCEAVSANGGVVLGFGAERPDRLRYEFAWDGRLLSMTDAAGVELRYRYDNITPGELVPPAPADLGRLRTIYEPRSCSDPAESSCRAFRFGYSEDAASSCPVEASGPVRCIDDPAGRRTKYHLDSSSPRRLWKVTNPDGTVLRYAYQGVTPPDGGGPANCGGTPGQLCSAQDPRGAAASFAYTAAPGAPAGSPAQLTKLTDRRGSDLVLDYHAGAYTTADQAGHRRQFASIDAAGRVGQVDEGSTAEVYLRQALYTWDSPGAACRQPDGAADNNLCRLVRRALNGGVTPDEDTSWTYTAEGVMLTQRQANGTTPIETTWGYHVQYAQAGGATTCLDYAAAGNGAVTVGSAGCSARADGLTLFAISDQTESLTPRGNAAGATAATYRTTLVRDVPAAGGSINPNAVPGAPCAGTAGNTGLVCEARTPAFEAGGSQPVTRSTYDAFGQKATMTSPKAIAEGATTTRPACPLVGGVRLACTSYGYYADGDKDLSGLVSAGGWLKTVTDPAGQYVAFGYDRAGNVMRTWDRNATSRAAGAFPGTLASPPRDAANQTLPYAETLYADAAPAAAAATPGRYLRSSRDPLGNVTANVEVDGNGNRARIRSPRGHDTTQAFDGNDNLTSTVTPAPGAPTWLHAYDAFDNRTASTDPNGAVTVTDYDPVNRPLAAKWTRGPWTTGPAELPVPPACRQSGAGDAPIPTGRILCGTSTTYDGVDNITGTADGNAQTTTYTFDGVHRQTRRQVPRDATTPLPTETVYDLDGHPTDICPPRQFTDGGSPSCPANGIYSEHRAYGPAGRPTTSTRYRDDASPATALVTRHGYDADGNETSTTDPNNHTVTRVFDVLDRKTSEATPRDATTSNTTVWAYDPSGNVTSITRPGGVDNGTGADGDLVIDGTTASASTDGQAHPAGSPYLLPAGKNYRDVIVQNNGVISVAAYTTSGGVLELRAAGVVTVQAGSAITTAGKGPAGGAGGASATASGTAGAGNGGGGRGTSSAGGGGGGAGGGHAQPGGTGATIIGSGAPGPAGPAYGTADLSDTATLAVVGSGGGGGGGSLGYLGAVGGAGGGLIHLSAASISVQGTVSAAGIPGTIGVGSAGAGGGGSGGSVWLSAPTVTLNSASALNVNGAGGGTSLWGNTGGAGAPGRVRIDTDQLTGVANPASAWAGYSGRRVGRITAYRYDVDNRQVQEVVGADSVDAATAGVSDSGGGTNIRSGVAYDPDGNVVAHFEARAFATSAGAADARYMVRTDYDPAGRPVGRWVPRYDGTAGGNDAGPSATQAADCPVPAGAHKPQAVAGVADYPAGVGVCLSRVEYDKAGNAVKEILPTAGWDTASGSPVDTNRYVAYAYTDDHLVASINSPSARTNDARVVSAKVVYDGVGQPVKTTDTPAVAGLARQRTRTYSADRLLIRTEEQKWTPAGGGEITHVTAYGYDANGNRASHLDALNQMSISTYWSDNLLRDVTDPGMNKTSYAYDRAGNPTGVRSPSANARDATNPSGTATVNTYTADDLLLTVTTPVAGDGSSGRRVSYTYDGGGRKTAQVTATVTATGTVTATAGTQRFAWQPDDRLRQEVGRDGATITSRYDPAGNRLEVADSSGSVITGTYYLDGLPRTVNDAARPTAYSYDGAGQPTYRADAQSTTPGAARYATTYTSNDAGLPATMTSSLTGSGTWAWAWDEAGRPTTETAPNGQSVTRTWNPDDTLARQTLTATTGTLADWAYTYDPLYRQKTQGYTQTLTGSPVAGTHTYGYDPAGRLVSFNDGTATKTLTWDHDGNRLTYGAEVFTFNADDSIKTADPDGTGSTPTLTYGYTTFGGTATDGAKCFAYDGFDRLARVATTGPQSSCSSGTTTDVTYLYDGLDRQRSRTALTGTTGTTGFHTDGWTDTLTVEIPSSGNDTAYAISAAGTNKAVATQGLLGTTQYLTDDGHGNITTTTSTAAVTACAARFDPFGNPTGGGSDNNPCASGSTPNNTFYRGGRLDKTTGAYQLGARTYDPNKNAFLTADNYRTGGSAQNLGIGIDPLTRG